MKNRKGQTIPQPYLDLAMMRREQQELSEGMKVWYKKLNNNIENSALNEALKKEHEDIDKMYLELLEIHQKACAEIFADVKEDGTLSAGKRLEARRAFQSFAGKRVRVTIERAYNKRSSNQNRFFMVCAFL